MPLETALIVIDVQKAIDHSSWGERNNPDAEQNIAALLAAWRSTHRPIYHIRHDSTEPDSHYRPGQPGNDFKPEAQPLVHEMILAKTTNSAFIGTGLEATLTTANLRILVVVGVLSRRGLLPRTRRIVPGELAVSD